MTDNYGYYGNRPQRWPPLESDGYIFYDGLSAGGTRLSANGRGLYNSNNSLGPGMYAMTTHNDPDNRHYDTVNDVKKWGAPVYENYDVRDRKHARPNSASQDPRSSGLDGSNDERASSAKGGRGIFVRFAQQCSMQGPPYIYNSKLIYAKVLWVILLLVAIGFMTFHLYYLIKTYVGFPVQNEVKLGFSSLQFPAVTICNVNPVRRSELNTLSPEFAQLLADLDLDRLGDIIDKLPNRNGTDNRRRKRQVDPSDPLDYLYDNFIDDLNINFDNLSVADPREDLEDADYEEFDEWDNSWEGENEPATFTQIQERITDFYATLDRQARISAGHQLEDMLVSCAFSGRKCYADNFTLSTSMTYGNCYTLEYNKLMSRSSGPNGGLELIIYLENDEYLPGIQADSGLQVMVHPQKSMTFPEDEGLAVGGGTHTFLSLSLVQVERKGSPYGDCTDNSDFLKQYRIVYTRQTCQKFCEQRTIHRRCSCRDETKEDLNIIMKVNPLKPCRTKSEVKCMTKAYWDYGQGRVPCACNNPCTDTKYEKTLSSRTWPHPTFASLLVKTLCHRESTSVCDSLKDKQTNSPMRLSEEFVKLNIFYEDLNYENITEKPDYEDVQFISDIGGTLGLWIGLSVLSIFEVFQLGLELLRHFFCCRWRNTASANRG